MYVFECQKRVRYSEIDQMGYLYHGRYVDYYEIGRAEMLRALGMTYREMEEKHRVMLPVASLEMRYVRPARYDEMLTIRTTLREMPTDKHMVFYVEVINEAKKIVNGGRVRLVFVDMNTMRPIPAPSFFTEMLQPFFPENCLTDVATEQQP